MKIRSLFKKYAHLLLRFLGYKIFKVGPYSVFDFESFLYRHLVVHKTLVFLQIGANDGVMNDPIYRFNMDNKCAVSGYVMEPLPDIFQQLVNNYKNCPKIKPINMAIHATESEMMLHRLNPEYESDAPDFAKGIASFNESHWEKTKLVHNADLMQMIKVKCISFNKFIESNSINKLDLLLLDTEGYDYEILMSIDFYLVKPKMIRFEHGVRNNLMSPQKFLEVCTYLNAKGYQIIAESYDATAYLLDPQDLDF